MVSTVGFSLLEAAFACAGPTSPHLLLILPHLVPNFVQINKELVRTQHGLSSPQLRF